MTAYPPPFQPPHIETRKKGNKGKITAAVAAFVGLSVVGLGLMQEPEPVAASAETTFTTTSAAPATTPRATTTAPRTTTGTTTAVTTTAETVTVYAPPPTTVPYVETPYVDVPDVDRAYVPAPAPFVAPAPAPYVAPAPAPYVAPAVVPEPSGSAYYKNCTAARNAGAAPVRVGDPGYGSHLDRDGDGVGCE